MSSTHGRGRLASMVGRALVAMPAAVLAVTLALAGRGFYRQGHITGEQIYQAVDRHLRRAPARSSLPLLGSHRAVAYRPCSALDERAWLDGPAGRPSIYLFGESSLVLSDGPRRVHEFLRDAVDELSPGVSIVNLALCGIDSFVIRRWVPEAMQIRPDSPSIAVLYMGHNDYNNAHAKAVSPLYNQFPAAMWLIHHLSPPAWNDPDWTRRIRTGPEVKWAQKLGLIEIPLDGLFRYNELIVGAFEKNMDAILEAFQSRGVPVIVVTPVANLRMEPYGATAAVTEPFMRGMAERDYRKSLALLRQARDAAHLTADTAAKTPLVEYIRGLRRDGVYPLDFEAQLEGEAFDFGSSGFSDYLHLRESLHAKLARSIARLIHDNPELAARLRQPGTSSLDDHAR